MHILIISDFNIGGQCTALMKAINKYTEHEARCIIAHDDHFAYDRDIILSKETIDEASDLANNWADFYHFGSYIFNWPGVNFNKQVTKRNCCIKYYGSYLRDHGRQCQEFHRMTGIAAITGTDFTITGLLPESYYHLSSYFVKFGDMNPEMIPRCKEYVGISPLSICAGSAGHPNKGYDVLVKVMNELDEEKYPVDLEFIQGVSNQVCLERKAAHHVNFCSISGGWGISGVESMFMGQPTMTCIDPFILSMFPRQPSILVNRETLKDRIKELIGDQDLWHKKSVESYSFAMANFRWDVIIEKYIHLIDVIMNKDSYLKGGALPKLTEWRAK